METILSSQSLFPLSNPKPSSPTPSLSPSLYFRSNSVCQQPKPISSSLKKEPSQSLKPSSAIPSSSGWISFAQQGLAALALSLALNFSPVLFPSGSASASEFDVLNDGPPKESYVVDDAGVLSRVTRSDLKRLLSDLESRKNLRINFITVRKLTVSCFLFLQCYCKLFFDSLCVCWENRGANRKKLVTKAPVWIIGSNPQFKQ